MAPIKVLNLKQRKHTIDDKHHGTIKAGQDKMEKQWHFKYQDKMPPYQDSQILDFVF